MSKSKPHTDSERITIMIWPENFKKLKTIQGKLTLKAETASFSRVINEVLQKALK